MPAVPLTNGGLALVDERDRDRVLGLTWRWRRTPNGQVVVYHRNARARLTLVLHRFILNVPAWQRVDHANGDRFDNRRSNLRVCTQQENRRNSRLRGDSRTGFKGVRLRRRNAQTAVRFQAEVRIRSLRIYGPRRSSAIEAARDYDAMAREHFGHFACINFPLAGERGALVGAS